MQKITLVQYANNIKIKAYEKPSKTSNKNYIENMINSMIKNTKPIIN